MHRTEGQPGRAHRRRGRHRLRLRGRGAGRDSDLAPDPDWHGTDAFVFEADDGLGASATATVTITVRPVYDAPAIEAFAVDRDSVGFGEPVTSTWRVRHVDESALTCRIETGAAVHELGDCAGEDSQFHLYPNVTADYEAQLVVDDGTSGPLTSLPPLVGIAASTFHTLALKADGTVVRWGQAGGNDKGQSDFPADSGGIVAIAGGRTHSLALTADRKVVGWGDDEFGQASPPVGDDTFVRP